MVKLPENMIKLEIEAMIEETPVIQADRPYLGISAIGNDCARALWYSFRWTTERQFTARIHRLLNRGHREEPIIVADLKAIGCKVFDRQRSIVTGEGHIKGHIDGIVSNVPDAPKTPHLLEMKTANDNNFKKIKDKGVKKAKPDYYAQCQCYMDKLKLKRALFVAVNKNTDERYYERIHFDRTVSEYYFDRAMDIITSEAPPIKIGESTWFACKWCDHYEVCQFDKPVLKNCRTCHYLDLHPKGRWRCSTRREPRGVKRQREGCSMWELMEGLKK